MKLLNKFLKALLIYQIIILFVSVANMFINDSEIRVFVLGANLSNIIVLFICECLINHGR